VWVVLLVMLGFGAVGWVDDWRKVVYAIPRGCPRAQALLAIVIAESPRCTSRSRSRRPTTRSSSAARRWVQSGFALNLPPKADLIVPFFKTISYPLGVWGFIALSYFVIVGTSNAVTSPTASTASRSCPR
jgi:phospho-N-acetylmuramoyl-pentapeptide-transferase